MMNPSISVRPVGIVAFPGVEILDISGPLGVFSFANFAIKKQGLSDQDVYPVSILAAEAGAVTTHAGLQIVADESYKHTDAELDTLVIPGSGDIDLVLADSAMVDWVKQMAPKVRRLVSVCTGAFVLAESGLLDNCTATTHWNWCRELAEKYPRVNIEADRIFVKDGNILTSGGVTSGIDMALAMLEEDWGRELAMYVARFLVVFLKRPGGQSQFSSYLTDGTSNRADIRELQEWIIQHPDADLRVETMAERMSMSLRNFSRLFFSETGMTPAKYVEKVRIDAARHCLEMTHFSIETVAEKSGFKDVERMRRAFLRHFGVNPSDYRKRFG